MIILAVVQEMIFLMVAPEVMLSLVMTVQTRLIGGDGVDTLTGGLGRDTFVLDAGSTDSITDFDVSAILSNEASRTGINDRLEFAITYSDLIDAGVASANIGNANYGFRYYLVEDSDPTTAYGWKLDVKYGLLSAAKFP